MSPQNNSVIYFPFKGLIWKLLIDPSSSILAVEWRDEDYREAGFSAIDLGTKKQLWEGVKTKEKWWIGMETVKEGLLLLHGYKDIQNPEHKGIFAYDLHRGTFLWEHERYTFIAIHAEYLLVYDAESAERAYHKLSLREGRDLGEVSEKEALLRNAEDKTPYITNSLHYSSENKYFEKISAFTEAFTGKKPEEALDYLEHLGKIIVSFYIKEEEKLVNYLLVINEEGEILLEDKIGGEMKGIGMDTFFLYKDLLIFVKNKKELVIFGL